MTGRFAKVQTATPSFRNHRALRAGANELEPTLPSKPVSEQVRADANDFAVGLPLWAPAYLARCRDRNSKKRVVCGGRRRRDGKPCEALSVPGKRRCRWHGGCSTGPRTPEGKIKVTRNLPRHVTS